MILSCLTFRPAVCSETCLVQAGFVTHSLDSVLTLLSVAVGFHDWKVNSCHFLFVASAVSKTFFFKEFNSDLHKQFCMHNHYFW